MSRNMFSHFNVLMWKSVKFPLSSFPRTVTNCRYTGTYTGTYDVYTGTSANYPLNEWNINIRTCGMLRLHLSAFKITWSRLHVSFEIIDSFKILYPDE